MKVNICGMNLEKTATLVTWLLGVAVLFECLNATSWLQLYRGLKYKSKLLCKHIYQYAAWSKNR